ncbi:bifunctional diaminohydroxyphosphoribosylaminopyrimidine deaminase/5-amino-6-(5-phosphoribosylamino)uracil reductase RibD [Tumebacillus sp. ITR2]|uniref:Riboflavin biosynthesis protein RibD n=1 Tax=Tumebacillus amylolyticus TaxID=2801339 RepID=A0ABS1JBG8_9BACL|nr:bifunctional diaminohydroxyphosphoribosylaminopyrimidine deaminase/5-amino-6-(5-phosphoribosylamino)uracil reductase RibD [Tumebacillus amylolyticus]MBL0387608.1 bifunctional diaminohydroxyphosphoribosylaminopyrimidine deaminase/5-amino-6-(5-phosphoribosylamino)uracil reductase RibD [Tumebacillus amylolyticus]
MTDVQYMQMALDLAAQAKGQTNPNPLVGAVLVKDGRIVGFGAHLKAGEPHAEVHAFRMAGEHAEGATLYVTLEPCSHHGKTPPCADLVISSKVKKVVVAMTDPNPLVAGNGINRIRAHGIEVEVGVLESQAVALNERFLHNMRTSRPFVVIKTAMTLDGKIAAHTGDSRWITGPDARVAVHQLRNEVDGILVGIGTVRADDPELTTRMPEGGGKHPTRIILDSSLQIEETAKVLDTSIAPTWIITSGGADAEKSARLRARGVQILKSAPHDVAAVLDLLYANGITHLLVEGGATVNGAFLQAGLIDKVMAFIAPKLIGGAGAPTPYAGAGFEKMSQAVTLRDISVTTYGDDICITGYPVYEGEQQ